MAERYKGGASRLDSNMKAGRDCFYSLLRLFGEVDKKDFDNAEIFFEIGDGKDQPVRLKTPLGEVLVELGFLNTADGLVGVAKFSAEEVLGGVPTKTPVWGIEFRSWDCWVDAAGTKLAYDLLSHSHTFKVVGQIVEEIVVRQVERSSAEASRYLELT